MRYCSALILAAALAGCAAQTPRIQTVTVNVPVSVPCLTAADVPAIPARLARPLPVDANALLSLALAQLLRWQDFGDKSTALLTACAQPVPPRSAMTTGDQP